MIDQDINPPRIDGRTLRRSNRTVAFSTKVTPEFDRTIRAMAQQDNIPIVQVLERLLRAHEYRRDKLAREEEAASKKAKRAGVKRA